MVDEAAGGSARSFAVQSRVIAGPGARGYRPPAEAASPGLLSTTPPAADGALVLVTLPPNTPVLAAVEEYSANTFVEYAEPNFMYRLVGAAAVLLLLTSCSQRHTRGSRPV